MFKKYNPNPHQRRVGDCVVRAISTAMNMEWEEAYVELADMGLEMGDMPSSNHVWGAYLCGNGFSAKLLPNFCPECYTVKEFAEDHPHGTYVLGTGSHAVAVINGCYIDAWDSGAEVPIYYFEKEEY